MSLPTARRAQSIPLLGLIALGLLVGAVAIGARLATSPDSRDPPMEADPQAGLQAQHVLAQLVLREAGLTSRQDPLVLTAAQVNAFLAGHVEVRAPPVWPVHVEIGSDGLELGGVTTLSRLVASGVGPSAAWLLPGFVGNRPVWIAARGDIAVLPGGHAEFRAHTAVIGRQRVPVAALWRAVGGRPQALAWRMPRVVDRVDLEPGRLLIYTRRAGTGRGSPG
jgi:hypothetical protein